MENFDLFQPATHFSVAVPPTPIYNNVTVIDFNTRVNDLYLSDFFGSQTLSFQNMPGGHVTFSMPPDSLLIKLFYSPQVGTTSSWKIDIGNCSSLTLTSDNDSVTFITPGINTMIMEVVSPNPTSPIIHLQNNTGGNVGVGATGPTGPTGPAYPGTVTYYGYLYDTTEQKTVPDTPTPVLFNTISSSNGFTVENNGGGDPTRIKASQDGIYNLQFSAEFYDNVNTTTITVWLKKNDLDIPNSTRTFNVPSVQTVQAWNWIVELDTDQYVEIYWQTDGSTYLSQSSDIPSIISSIFQIMNTQSGPTGATGYTGAVGPTGATGAFDQVGAARGDYIFWDGSEWVSAISTLDDKIVLGSQAGEYSQGTASIAIGWRAGQTSQGTASIAIGYEAGQYSQGSRSTSMGHQSGNYGQKFGTVAIGYQAGMSGQSTYALSIGYQAGQYGQGFGSVAIGYQTGQTHQETLSVAVGYQAGSLGQGSECVAIGYQAGIYFQKAGSVALGSQAGNWSQDTNSIAIGQQSGQYNQLYNSIAIGKQAGNNRQSSNCVAIGYQAGYTNQLSSAIAIGYQAGYASQGARTIAIGYQAGYISQGLESIAIGYQAGYTGQGINSMAIGYKAGYSGMHEGSIILNSSGEPLSSNNRGLYVSPLRNVSSTYCRPLYYVVTDKEIVYNENNDFMSSSIQIVAATGINLITDTLYITTNNIQITGATDTFVGYTGTFPSIFGSMTFNHETTDLIPPGENKLFYIDNNSAVTGITPDSLVDIVPISSTGFPVASIKQVGVSETQFWIWNATGSSIQDITVKFLVINSF